MPYYDKEQIEKAREMDLLTYLQSYDPNELVPMGHGVYCKLLQQPEKEAKELALSLELFTVGSLGAFAYPCPRCFDPIDDAVVAVCQIETFSRSGYGW